MSFDKTSRALRRFHRERKYRKTFNRVKSVWGYLPMEESTRTPGDYWRCTMNPRDFHVWICKM